MKNNKAMISIFLSLLILPVYSFAIVSIDIVKLFSVQNHVLNANEVAIHSVLSKYDRSLYEKFNLFAINNNDEYLNAYVNNILIQNIEENKSDYYNVKLISSNLDQNDENKLVYPENLKKQILDYMALKGPYLTGKGILNLVEMIFDSRKYTAVMNKKMDYEEEYSKFNRNMDNLSENIIYYDKNFKEINQNFFELNLFLNRKKTEIKLIIDEYKKIEDDKPYIEDSETTKNIKNILKEISKYNEDLWTKIALLQTKVNNIIFYLEALSRDSTNIQFKLDSWKEDIDQLDRSDIKSNLNSEYKAAKEKFTKKNIDNLLNKFLNHKDSFNKMKTTLEGDSKLYKPNIEDLDYFLDSKYNLENNKKLPSLNNFKIYKNIVKNNETLEITKDQVNEAKNNKREIEELSKKYNTIENKKNKNKLSDFISSEDIDKILNFNPDSVADINASSNIKNFKKIMSNTVNFIPKDKNNIVDKYYLAQYIIEKFNNKLSEEEFSSQIEYILFGNDKLNSNNFSVQNLIFGIRFILNSLYAYTNTDLKVEATTMATAIAGWTGFGVPLLRSLILGGMAFGESIIDINDLNTKNSVNIYKNKGTWKISVSGINNWLHKEIKDIASATIDNIYDLIENKTNESLDEVEKELNEFIGQSMDGVTETIMSEVVSPIYTTLVDFLGFEIDVVKGNITNRLDEIEKSLTSVNPIIDKIKKEIFNYVKLKYSEFINLDGKEIIENYFKKLRFEIQDMIALKLSNINNKFKNNIKSILSKDKINKKEFTNKYIDEYLKGLGQENVDNLKGLTSGLSFKYKDYLTAVTILRLMTDERAILNRISVLIDAKMKQSNSLFDIMNMYTRYNLESKVDINTLILKKYIFKDTIKNTIIGGY